MTNKSIAQTQTPPYVTSVEIIPWNEAAREEVLAQDRRRAEAEKQEKEKQIYELGRKFFTIDPSRIKVTPYVSEITVVNEAEILEHELWPELKECNHSKGQEYQPGGSFSTLEVVQKFLASKRAANLTPASIKTYTQDYKPFIRRFPCPPTTPEGIEGYLQSFPPPSKRQQYNRLYALYRFASKRYNLPNPMLDIEKPKVKEKPQRVLFPEDAIKVEANLKDAVERGIFYLGYGMGWRSGEIRHVKCGDIGTDSIVVRGKERDETVSLLPEIRDCLLALCDGQKPDSPLFRGQRGALTKNGIWEKVKKILGRVGVDGSPHSLRHGYGTALAMQGCDAHSIMRLMRHKDIEQAITYVHLTDRHLAKTQQAYCPLGIVQTADKNRV